MREAKRALCCFTDVNNHHYTCHQLARSSDNTLPAHSPAITRPVVVIVDSDSLLPSPDILALEIASTSNLDVEESLE